MADIAKITLPDDSEYDIKDGVARNSLSGGTSGQVLAKVSDSEFDTEWVDSGMTILSYGHSTWADFDAAFKANKIVYCKAGTGTNPASGAQPRMAFLAYFTNTTAEFQYYRSVKSHSDVQQGDQVYIYTLSSASKWTLTVRESYTKIAAGAGISSSYNNGTLTLSNSQKIPNIVTEDYSVTYDQTAGTIGTLFLDETVSIGKSGYNSIGVYLKDHENNNYAMITTHISGNTLHVCGYRADASERTNQTVTATVLYMEA